MWRDVFWAVVRRLVKFSEFEALNLDRTHGGQEQSCLNPVYGIDSRWGSQIVQMERWGGVEGGGKG